MIPGVELINPLGIEIMFVKSAYLCSHQNEMACGIIQREHEIFASFSLYLCVQHFISNTSTTCTYTNIARCRTKVVLEEDSASEAQH